MHLFHIPVLGLGYTIDTPIKVARFGISSVISIVDDELIEQMRKYHAQKADAAFIPIKKNEADSRAKRITAYLNLVNNIVTDQVAALRQLPFEPDSEITKYFEMLPGRSPVRQRYNEMIQMESREARETAENELRNEVVAGSIDVNIMAKVDKINYTSAGEILPVEYSDALSSLRGFAKSDLTSSVVFSAGYNPRLYSYIENFKDFFPDENGYLKKKIILKVSDYRSALVQGKILAKKGLWVSEFRIESGLNCGGHAFATDGILLGPVLEEFKNKRSELAVEILAMCNIANIEKGYAPFNTPPDLRITVQGGIGTSNENTFLLDNYSVDSTGWGSPFLLVPEATNVDDNTLSQLASAQKEDYYLSHISPLGIPFNNFRKSTSELQRKERIEKGKPGSPCYKQYLISNTEFTEIPICTASRQYQDYKIKQLKEKELPVELFNTEYNTITQKDCLCEGLAAPALLKNRIPLSHKLSAVTICPGPNLAYFSGTYMLSQMIDHIYGRINILNHNPRPNMFVNELQLYIDYFKVKLEKLDINTKQVKYLHAFKANLIEGIEYYKNLLPSIKVESEQYISSMKIDLKNAVDILNELYIPSL